MNRIALTRVSRTFVLVVAAVAALGGCVRPYLRAPRDPVLAASAPCRGGEPCPEGAGLDSGGFLWAADVMESAR